MIIAVTNQKGGVGKTTLAANLGFGLSMLKKRVLLIDLDAQANLSGIFGVVDSDKNVGDLLLNKYTPNTVIRSLRPTLDLIPSTRDLSDIEITIVSKIGRENLLANSMKSIKGYDYILIDCPPSLDILTINAMCYANNVLIPMILEPLALQGLNELLSTIRQVKASINHKLQILGVVNTKHNGRRNLTGEILNVIKDRMKLKVYKSFIRENVKVAESPSFQKTVIEYNKNSNGAQDYMSLAQEFSR